ncbi:hypothetical protein ASE03_12985 [Kitasatospora sp. Root187]|nr:hypothetical protein ASC99_20190 [Kitasatospora sp. Root107]KRB60512.1 hypothetical protein ASE03_12985 [Kitasatospora sp. Root187]
MPAALERLLHHAAIGPCTVLGTHYSGRTGEPVVWELQDRYGRRVFGKTYREQLPFAREVTAYTNLLTTLGPGRAPQLLGHDESARLIVTTALPGTPLRHFRLEPELEAEAYRQAGHLAAQLHSQPLPPDPVPERQPWAEQRAEALATARELRLPAEDVELLADAMEFEPPRLPPAVCHGGFGPRNWIVQLDGGVLRLGLIDFERTGVSEGARHDLMRLLFQLTPERPELRQAFFDGYGRQMSEEEQVAARAYAALDCPSALAWAARHRDAEIHRYGHTMLAQLRRFT